MEFTARERHTLAYTLDLALARGALDLDPVKTPTDLYWVARVLGTMGRLYLEVVEGLA